MLISFIFSLCIVPYCVQDKFDLVYLEGRGSLVESVVSDFNSDQHNDILNIFMMNEKGEYPNTPKINIIDVLNDDGYYELEAPKIYFEDINNDKQADLIVSRLEGTFGLLDSLRTKIYIHLGNKSSGYICNSVVSLDGYCLDLQLSDVSGNGSLELITFKGDTALLKKGIEMFLLGDVAGEYEVRKYDPKKERYSDDNC